MKLRKEGMLLSNKSVDEYWGMFNSCNFLTSSCTDRNLQRTKKLKIITDSVYKKIELIGTSPTSLEDAAANAITKASKSLRDLRIAEVSAMDNHLKEGEIEFYRTKVKLSFKFEA